MMNEKTVGEYINRKRELIDRVLSSELGSIDTFGLTQYYQEMRYRELFEEYETPDLLEMLGEDDEESV